MDAIIFPVLKTFTITKGTSFDYRFQYLQGVPTSAISQDLTGWSSSLTITTWDGLTTLLTLSSTATSGNSGIFFGGDLRDPTNGIIDIVITSTDTGAVAWKTARYNMTVTDTLSVVTRILYGSFSVFGFLP